METLYDSFMPLDHCDSEQCIWTKLPWSSGLQASAHAVMAAHVSDVMVAYAESQRLATDRVTERIQCPRPWKLWTVRAWWIFSTLVWQVVRFVCCPILQADVRIRTSPPLALLLCHVQSWGQYSNYWPLFFCWKERWSAEDIWKSPTEKLLYIGSLLQHNLAAVYSRVVLMELSPGTWSSYVTCGIRVPGKNTTSEPHGC